MSVDEGGWRWQTEIIRKQFPGIPITSAFRSGSVAAGGKGGDYHSRGRAIDLPPRMDVFNWIAANYPGTEELIFTPAGARQIKDGRPHVYSNPTAAGHYNHVHWAIVSQSAPGGGATTDSGSAPSPVPFAGLIGALAFITNQSMWVRVGVAIGGVILLLLAFARLTKQLPSMRKMVKSVSR